MQATQLPQSSARSPRALISTEGQRHTSVIYLTKKDGTRRRMVCRYTGAMSRKPDQKEERSVTDVVTELVQGYLARRK